MFKRIYIHDITDLIFSNNEWKWPPILNDEWVQFFWVLGT